MTQDELDQLIRLVDTYTARYAQIEAEARRQVAGEFVGVDPYDAAAVAAAAAGAAGVSAYATNTVVGLASQFYLLALSLMGGDPPRLNVANVDIGAARGGDVDLVSVYERPAKRYRINITDRLDTAAAAADAERLLQQTIDADLMLAQRAAMAEMLAATATITKYRRVVRPELSQTGVCGLCLAAADQVYTKKDLLPLHHRCKCIVLPIVEADARVPEYVNEITLSELYTAADSTSGRELKKIRYRIEDHGELGPVLVQQGHRFTGPNDLAA